MLLVAALAIFAGCSRLPEVQANDNRTRAGELKGDTLHIRLVVQRARWHPEASKGPSIVTEVFAEEGGSPQIPAPLIRVPTGTIVSVAVRNSLSDSTVGIHGLYTRPAEHDDSVVLAPGESKTVTFAAGVPGTYMYGAQVGKLDDAVRERDVLAGAFVVDSSGVTPNDRVFVMNIWGEQVDSNTYSNALAINGKSYPYTQRIEVTTGDTIRWRWINATVRPHPMHLHGFYFTIHSRGFFLSDTAYDPAQQPSVVTEPMEAFHTMSMSWVPDRDGQWLFHCHIPYHAIASDARLEPPKDHQAMTSDDPGEHMAGLVLPINVKPAPGWTAEPRPSPRSLRLFVQQGPKLGHAPRTLGYVIEHSSSAPTEPLTHAGGPPLILTRGQPTDITVINQLNEPTVVHWHGLELESYSDGVSGFSGHRGHVAPSIAPSDSFTARLTMRRAGTFMYHTHLNDLEQLTSGLYGAMIVREPREPFDPSTDHVFVAGWDGLADPGRLVINGDSILPPMTWRAGSTHRIRLIYIGAATLMRIRMLKDSTLMTWRPAAKDGADLPAPQAMARPAEVTMYVGETADFLVTASQRGEYTLTFQKRDDKEPRIQRIVVR
jgi:FtsP/CotA-like multicopper oxidase with cupredoxin domain